MMGSGGGASPNVLEGLLHLVTDPTAFAATIKELKDAQAAAEKAQGESNLAKANAEAALRKAQEDQTTFLESLKVREAAVIRAAELNATRESDLQLREDAISGHDANLSRREAVLSQNVARYQADMAAFQATLVSERGKHDAELSASSERVTKELNARAADLDNKQGKLEAQIAEVAKRAIIATERIAEAESVKAEYSAKLEHLRKVVS